METIWSAGKDDAQASHSAACVGVGRHLRMAANEERKPRGQQECAERRMLTLSSSNIDLHIIVDGVIVFSFYLR